MDPKGKLAKTSKKAIKNELSLEIHSGPMDVEQFTELYARLRKESPTRRLNFSGINLKGISPGINLHCYFLYHGLPTSV
jgi:hypothetical protein